LQQQSRGNHGIFSGHGKSSLENEGQFSECRFIASSGTSRFPHNAGLILMSVAATYRSLACCTRILTGKF
jgi:hypothetical protein